MLTWVVDNLHKGGPKMTTVRFWILAILLVVLVSCAGEPDAEFLNVFSQLTNMDTSTKEEYLDGIEKLESGGPDLLGMFSQSSSTVKT